MQSLCNVRLQHLFDLQNHHCLVHPCGWLTMVEVVRRVNTGGKLKPRDAAIWLPLIHKHRREYCAIGIDGYCHGNPLCVIRRCSNVDCFFSISSSVHLAFMEK